LIASTVHSARRRFAPIARSRRAAVARQLVRLHDLRESARSTAFIDVAAAAAGSISRKPGAAFRRARRFCVASAAAASRESTRNVRQSLDEFDASRPMAQLLL
jgi:hypothetical protein